MQRDVCPVDPHAVRVQSYVPDERVLTPMVPIVELAAGPVCGCPRRLSVLSAMYMLYVWSVVSVTIILLHLLWHI